MPRVKFLAPGRVVMGKDYCHVAEDPGADRSRSACHRVRDDYVWAREVWNRTQMCRQCRRYMEQP